MPMSFFNFTSMSFLILRHAIYGNVLKKNGILGEERELREKDTIGGTFLINIQTNDK